MRTISLLGGLTFTLSFVMSVLAVDVTDYTLTPQSLNQASPVFAETDLSPTVTEFDYDCALTNIGIRAPRDDCIWTDDSLDFWVRVYNVGSEVVDSAQLLFTLDSVAFDSLVIRGLYPGGSVKVTATTITPPACEAYIIDAHLHWPPDENPDNDDIEDIFATAEEADTCLCHCDGHLDGWTYPPGHEYPDWAAAAKYHIPFEGVVKYWTWWYTQSTGYPRGHVELFVWAADTSGYPLDHGTGGICDVELQIEDAIFPDIGFVCYPICIPVEADESYFFGYSNRQNTLNFFHHDLNEDNPEWNWYKMDGQWYRGSVYPYDLWVELFVDRAGVMMTCENLTPIFCRGKNFYFQVMTVNQTSNPIDVTMTFTGWPGFDCDSTYVLAVIPRAKTIPVGTHTANYFLRVPNGVAPGDYSASVSFEYNHETHLCCMNATIIQCEPWRMGDNTEWELVEGDHREVALPTVTELHQNYPNPFNAKSNISYTLAEAGNVSLKVYDITGRLAVSLLEEYQEAGGHQVIWDGSGLSSGVYFCKLQTADFTDVKKMNLLK